MQGQIEVIGVRLIVECDERSLVKNFFEVFSIFESSYTPSETSREIRVRVSDRDGRFEGGGRSVDLAPGGLRAVHVYNLLYSTLLRSIPGAFLLHAAAIVRCDRAILIGGPSGSGKSSLARALGQRGFGLLSDDIAPLDLDSGRVHPFPRRVGIAKAEQTLLESIGSRATRLGDKVFVAPEALGSSFESRPADPGAVLLLDPYIAENDTVRITVGILGGAEAFEEKLRGIGVVRVKRPELQPSLTVVDLELRGRESFGQADRTLAEFEDRVLFTIRRHGPDKSYAQTPRIERISTRVAVMDLLREMLNREPASALMKRNGGSISAAMFELAGLIDDVPCYRLSAADVDSTAELVAARFDGFSLSATE